MYDVRLTHFQVALNAQVASATRPWADYQTFRRRYRHVTDLPAECGMCVLRCGKLRKENDLLELKANALMKELAFLKEMFLTHASELTLQ